MIRTNKFISVWIGVLLFFLAVFSYMVYVSGIRLDFEAVPRSIDFYGAVLPLALILVLLGGAIGHYTALQNYFGRVLETDCLGEGEYSCSRIATRIFWIKSQNGAKKRIFQIQLPFDVGPSMDSPEEKEFILRVSRETGYRSVDSKPPKRFTRYLYLATWTAWKGAKSEVCNFNWTSDDQPA